MKRKSLLVYNFIDNDIIHGVQLPARVWNAISTSVDLQVVWPATASALFWIATGDFLLCVNGIVCIFNLHAFPHRYPTTTASHRAFASTTATATDNA